MIECCNGETEQEMVYGYLNANYYKIYTKCAKCKAILSMEEPQYIARYTEKRIAHIDKRIKK